LAERRTDFQRSIFEALRGGVALCFLCLVQSLSVEPYDLEIGLKVSELGRLPRRGRLPRLDYNVGFGCRLNHWFSKTRACLVELAFNFTALEKGVVLLLLSFACLFAGHHRLQNGVIT